MEKASIATVVGTLLTGIVAGVFGFMNSPAIQNWITKILTKPNPKPMESALTAYSRLNQLCQEFAKLPGIKKGVIVETKNNGGIPRPGCIIYSSINFPEEWRSTWHNQPLDNEYADLLLRIFTEKDVEFFTKDLNSDGILKGLFEAQGIDFCYCTDLKTYTEKYFFLAIDFYDKDLVYENQYVKNQMRLLITEIKSIMHS